MGLNIKWKRIFTLSFPTMYFLGEDELESEIEDKMAAQLLFSLTAGTVIT